MNTQKILGILTGIAIATLPVLTFAVGNYITLPEGFISDLLAYVGQLFTDLNLLVILAIGLPLGFWVIRKAISLVRAR
jgi:hypothetical protein